MSANLGGTTRIEPRPFWTWFLLKYGNEKYIEKPEYSPSIKVSLDGGWHEHIGNEVWWHFGGQR
jgi:hypothetical protein